MKKILSFCAAILFAAGMMADPVVLPATLDVSNVSFRSEGMPDFTLAEGDYAGTYFDMGAHDSANDTLLYAEWDVTIQPIKYNVAVVVYNTNSWRVQLDLLNQSDEVVKAIRYKGSSGQCGQYAIGALDLSDLAAGNYKVRVHAATAWSAMKLRDVIFEADYQGVNVALPGTLLPAYALLSTNASVANNAIAFKPSTANEEYAIWNVNFAQAGTYNVSIDITATNGHTYGVALLSADGATQIGAVAEAQAWDTGVKELGAIAVPAAGNYVVKLTNATQWSEAVLNSITFAAPAAPAEPKTIYCKVQQGWWTDGNAAVGIYAWGEGVAANAEWPGVRMTAVEGQNGVWTFDLPAQYTSVVFTRINPSDEGDLYWGAKTNDLVVPTDDNDMYTITSTTAQWDGEGNKAQGEWGVYVPEVPAKFYITGIDDNWEPNAIKSTEDSYVLHLAAGAYALKITVDGSWNTVKGFSDLTEVADGLSTVDDGYNNIHFTLDEAGDVTVTYTASVFKLEGNFHVEAPAAADRRILAYDLNVVALGEDSYTFSYYANIAGNAANLVFYNNGVLVGRVAVDAPVAGLNEATLTKAQIPAGTGLTWGVELKADPVLAFAKIYADASLTYNRAYANVDIHPESDYFGKVYVANRVPTKANSRLYIYNQTYTKDANDYQLGESVWDFGRFDIAENGKLYLSDYGDAHSGCYIVDPADLTHATQFFVGTRASSGLITNGTVETGSSLAATHIFGEGANAKLFAVAEDYTGSYNGFPVAVYNIGNEDGTIKESWATAPNTLFATLGNAAQNFEIRGCEYGAWVASSRAAGQNNASATSLRFYDFTGTCKYTSSDYTEVINGSMGGGFTITEDGSTLYLVNGNGNILEFALTWNDGTPSLNLVATYETEYNAISSMNVDFAGNLVVTAGSAFNTKNNDNQLGLAVYAMPTNNNEIIVPAKKALTVEGTDPNPTTAIDETYVLKVEKIIRNGQVYIVRDGVVYTITGTRVQ